MGGLLVVVKTCHAVGGDAGLAGESVFLLPVLPASRFYPGCRGAAGGADRTKPRVSGGRAVAGRSGTVRPMRLLRSGGAQRSLVSVPRMGDTPGCGTGGGSGCFGSSHGGRGLDRSRCLGGHRRVAFHGAGGDGLGGNVFTAPSGFCSRNGRTGGSAMYHFETACQLPACKERLPLLSGVPLQRHGVYPSAALLP